MEVFLYNSTVCRLCGEENDNGSLLYSCEDNNQNLSEIVNAYLPIKVSDDGELPRTICPGCAIQLEATVEFLNLIINGQKVIRELHQREKEYKKSVLNSAVTEEIVTENIVYEVNTSDGVYQVEHPIALQVAGLERPKRKRGRPPKKPKTPEELAEEAAKEQEYVQMKKNEERDLEPTGKRRRKTPTRFKEAVQGKELERIFKEEGVIDGDECKSKKDPDKPKEPEVIGHLEDSGELVVVGKGKGRGRPKGRTRPNREQCGICGVQFSCVGRYMSHVAAHGPVVFRCACGAACGSRLALDHHQRATLHRGHHVTHAAGDRLHQDQPESETVEDQLPTITIEEQTPPETDTEVSVVDDTPVMDSLPDLNEPNEVSEEQTITLSDTESKEPKQEVQDEFIEDTTENIPEETIVETVTEDNVVQEVQTTAQGKVKLKCNHCDKTYSSKQSKSLHMKAAHEGLRPFACGECGARFAYPRSLALHRLAHARHRPGAAQGFACDLCGKVLSHPSSVVYHKEAEHAGQKFVCNKCGKQFKHKQLLQRHQLVHSQNRPFTCKTCNATFKTKANLLNHQLLHSGVKRFSCEICKHKFAHKTSLTLHMRWHAGTKPFVCKTCGKSFSQKGNLAEHARIHSGEKPFACAACPRRFTTSSQHRLHARRHAERTRRARRATCPPPPPPPPPPRCTHCARAFPTPADLAKHNRLIHGQISLLTSANPPQIIEEPTVYEIQTQEDKLSIEEPNEDLEERVIYVAYDMDEADSPAIHILNSEQELEEAPKSISSCSLFGGESLLAAPLSPDPTHHIHPDHSPDQLPTYSDHMPVTDEQGNPLHFTMQDGTRLAITSADGKSLQVITQDGQTIPVEINGFAEEEEMDNPDTIVHQLNLQKTVDENVISPVTHFFTLV